MSYLFNNKVGFEDAAIDAFGRLKISEGYTLFESQNRYRDSGKFATLTATGGTAVHNSNESTMLLSVSGASGSRVVRQSRLTFPYQPGKSLLIFNTFAMAPTDKGLRQRVGYFTKDNGIFLEYYEDVLYFVLRSSSNGTLTETRIPQSQWNGDRMDGSGETGRIFDPTKGNIFWCDVEWLGVGDVRCGFIHDGRPVISHAFHNDNEHPTTYMTTACLSVRYEIENIGAGTSGRTMRQICSSVMSEGGYDPTNPLETRGTGITAVALTTKGVYYNICSIRLKDERQDSIVVPAKVDALLIPQNLNQFYGARWELLLNTGLTGATWASHAPTSAVEFSTSRVAVTGGVMLRSGFFTSTTNLQLGGGIGGAREFSTQLGRGLSGVSASDTITFAISAYTNGESVLGEMSWFEVV